MIEFKKNVNTLLPYDREQYISFLHGDLEFTPEWYGVSFQLNKEERELNIVKYFEFYEPLFKDILLYFRNNLRWIVNQDYITYGWFPNRENTLGSLRTLFKQNKIPNSFKGALICEKDDLLEFSKDLLTYPFLMFEKNGLLYDNLDISNSEIQFIIKVSGHNCVDLLSTDKELLRKVVDEVTTNNFNVKEYRNTSLWS